MQGGRGAARSGHARGRLDMNQRVFPPEFWAALLEVLGHSLVNPNGAKVRDLGSALLALEKFPKHPRSQSYAIATEQAGPRGQYWQIGVEIAPESVSISAHHKESFHDGDWTVYDGFSIVISVEEANAAQPESILFDHRLLPEIAAELRSARKWWTSVRRKPSSRQVAK